MLLVRYPSGHALVQREQHGPRKSLVWSELPLARRYPRQLAESFRAHRRLPIAARLFAEGASLWSIRAPLGQALLHLSISSLMPAGWGVKWVDEVFIIL